MNSENLQGILIKWNKPLAERDYNNLQEGDFTVLNHNKQCPVTDGSQVIFSGLPEADLYEWLMRKEGERLQGYDYRLFVENQIQRPTNTKDTVFTNYNIWATEYAVIRRSDDEIIAAIRQTENEANLSIQSESEKAKMSMLVPAVNDKVSQGLTLNDAEQAVRTRMLEIAEKAFRNAANAELLINVVKAGGTPNLDSGWEYDNITPQGFPFTA